MNIDIVNKEVAKKLNYHEKKVAKINQFYWDRNLKHLSTFDPRALNIEGICVIHPDPYFIKVNIERMINTIRKINRLNKYKKDSPKYLSIIQNYNNVLRGYWNLRKYYKYTN